MILVMTEKSKVASEVAFSSYLIAPNSYCSVATVKAVYIGMTWEGFFSSGNIVSTEEKQQHRWRGQRIASLIPSCRSHSVSVLLPSILAWKEGKRSMDL